MGIIIAFMIGVLITSLVVYVCLTRNIFLSYGEKVNLKLLKQKPKEVSMHNGYAVLLYDKYKIVVFTDEFFRNGNLAYCIENKNDVTIYSQNHSNSNTAKSYFSEHIKRENNNRNHPPMNVVFQQINTELMNALGLDSEENIFRTEPRSNKVKDNLSVDAILDKINKSGIESLSKAEKEFLDNHGDK